MTSSEFESTWSTLTEGSPPTPSTFRVVQNVPREGNLEGEAFSGCPYDGIGEFWQEEGILESLVPPPWPGDEAAERPGTPLIDRERSVQFPARVNVVMPGNKQDGDEVVKSLFFVRRKPGMSVSDFQDYWAQEHAPLVRKTPGLDRYVQYHVHPEVYQTGNDPQYDGVGELCWPDRETFRSSWSSAEIQEEQFRDTPNFLRTGEVVSAIVEGDVLFDRGT